jgi:hypothetical protein
MKFRSEKICCEEKEGRELGGRAKDEEICSKRSSKISFEDSLPQPSPSP